MAKATPKTQDAYLHDMLEAARLIRDYMAGVTFDEFWHNSEKRDAVALRLSVLGESAHRIDQAIRRPCPAFLLRASAECETASLMTMARWTSKSSGPSRRQKSSH